jgi:Ca2+-binding EF-hand superfamily protein
MYWACVFEGIRPLVEKKCDQALFRAMLSTFLHQAVPLEMSRFSRLVGTCNEEQFKKRSDEEYGKLLAIQGEGDHIELNLLLQLKGDLKMEGLNVEEIVHFMRLYDQDGDGHVDRREFREMLRKSIETAELFTGSETLDRVTAKQMEVLLLFDDWKKPGTWSPEDGQSLMSLLRRNKAAAMTSEERAKWYPVVRKNHKQTKSEQKDPVRKVCLSRMNGIGRKESKQEEAPCEVRLSLSRPYERGCDPSEISVHLLEAIVDGLLDTYFTFQLVSRDDDVEGKGSWDHEGRIASFQDDLDNKPAKGADPQLSHSRKVEVLKSEIAMQTRNPHYDEHFKLAINEDADTLLVQAWGREYGGSYGLIGRVLIRVNEIEEEEWEPGVEERRRYVQLLHHHRRLIIASMHAIR